MSTGHLVGYVGGLAVALGIGTAVLLNAPAASADASAAAPSPSSGHAGTAKSARVHQRTNTLAAMKPAPTRKPGAPTASVTLLMTAAGSATNARRDLSIAYDPVGDKTSVTVVDATTSSPIGSTVTVDGSAGAPVRSADGKRALITTTFHNPATDKVEAVAVVMDMTAGGQIGNTLGYVDASPMSASFAPDGTRAVVTLFLESTSQIWVATLDTKTGTQTGTATLDGYPFVAPVWNTDGTRVVITLSQLGGETTAVAVIDATTGDVAGTIPVKGYAKTAPIMTADGTRALVTTTIDNSNSGPSTRVTVIDTAAGWLAGNPLTFPGTARVSLLGDGRVALVTTNSGLVSFVDTRGANATPLLPLLPPFGFDLAAFFATPLGSALAPGLFVVGFLGSAILAFYVLPAILWVPALITDALRGSGLLPAVAATVV
ncbi:YncE family protein [Mycobacterium sp. EPa45]|uniref:YncE family protein n=1 Tax=Mycobacterium sp. EPa45 TaxID=1545728 RepID=UPI00118754D0|nr:hypothetical protein [Mycobacterium sp. EPa45]